MRVVGDNVQFENGNTAPLQEVKSALAIMKRILVQDSIGGPRLLAQLHFSSFKDNPNDVLTSVDVRELLIAQLLKAGGQIADAVRFTAQEAIVTDGGKKFELHLLEGEPIILSNRKHQRPEHRIIK